MSYLNMSHIIVFIGGRQYKKGQTHVLPCSIHQTRQAILLFILGTKCIEEGMPVVYLVMVYSTSINWHMTLTLYTTSLHIEISSSYSIISTWLHFSSHNLVMFSNQSINQSIRIYILTAAYFNAHQM